jgi:hypothetical protein
MPRSLRFYRNQSSHDRLVYDAMYTLRELSMILDIKEKSLSNRINSTTVIRDKHVRPVRPRSKSSPWKQFETKADELSNKFLRRSLICY